jgi:hypothetical protein
MTCGQQIQALGQTEYMLNEITTFEALCYVGREAHLRNSSLLVTGGLTANGLA